MYVISWEIDMLQDNEADCVRHTSCQIQSVYRLMINCTDRLNSFVDWPQQLHQTPIKLACNRFFYQRIGDRVTCFMCGVVLSSWDYEDDVIHEHKKWSKDCVYLKLTLPQ